MSILPKQMQVIILLATVSLVGLVYIQIRWIQDAVEIQKGQFSNEVQKLLHDVHYGVLEKDTVLAHQLVAVIQYSKRYPQRPIPTRLAEPANSRLKAAFDSIVKKNHFSLPFDYGVVADFHEHPEEKLTHHLPVLLGNGDTRRKSQEYVVHHTSLGGLVNEEVQYQKQGHKEMIFYAIGLHFPDEKSYLLTRVNQLLVISLVFIALLVGCFGVTLWAVYRQRKLATVKDNFINNLTHELKTPIFATSVALKVLKNHLLPVQDPKTHKYLAFIEIENSRLKEHAEKVLQLASLEYGTLKMELQQVDLHQVIKATVQQFEMMVEQQQGTLELALDATQMLLQADKTHLQNVFYNLLDNALKYADKTPHISVITRDTPQGITIWIKDNGVGIPFNHQKNIFDKFYRVPTGNLHTVKGFGLGLSYSKLVIEAHQGQIIVESQPKVGSSFSIKFPATSLN